MATLDLNSSYRRVLDSNSRLRQLREMRVPDILVRNENNVLQDAINDLRDHKEIEQFIADVGTDAFITYFNHIAGTEIRFPIGVTAKASHAA